MVKLTWSNFKCVFKSACCTDVGSLFRFMPGAKHWCFTLNNYTADHEEELKELGEGELVQYLCYGHESAPDTGTPHLQGYVKFEARKTLRQVRRLIRDAHLTKANGSPQQNREYCSKEDENFVEYGECPGGQGTRNDIHEAAQAAIGRVPLKDLANTYPTTFIKYHRGLERLRGLNDSTRDWKTEVHCYYGATGLGKTKKAWEDHPEAYIHPGGNWFDGYDGHGTVIFDDFGGSEFKITYLLKLLDRYAMRVPIKGGFVNWLPKLVVITSNYPPEDWFPNAKDEHVAALLRRIDQILHFTALGVIQIKPPV